MLPPDRMIAAIVTSAIAIFILWRIFTRTSQLPHLHDLAAVADGQLMPEGLFTIATTDAAVSYEHPNGKTESIAWDELRRVEIITTDEGPFLPDSFWVLTSDTTQCTIAQGAKGESMLLVPQERIELAWKSGLAETACFSHLQRKYRDAREGSQGHYFRKTASHSEKVRECQDVQGVAGSAESNHLTCLQRAQQRDD